MPDGRYVIYRLARRGGHKGLTLYRDNDPTCGRAPIDCRAVSTPIADADVALRSAKPPVLQQRVFELLECLLYYAEKEIWKTNLLSWVWHIEPERQHYETAMKNLDHYLGRVRTLLHESKNSRSWRLVTAADSKKVRFGARVECIPTAPPQPRESLLELLRRAPTGRVVIHDCGSPDSHGITSRYGASRTINTEIIFPVGHLFKFEIDKVSPGFLIALQWGRSGWFVLDFDQDVVCLPPSENKLLVPLRKPYFQDELEARSYLFLFLETPLPRDLEEALIDFANAQAPLELATLNDLSTIARGAACAKLTVRFVLSQYEL